MTLAALVPFGELENWSVRFVSSSWIKFRPGRSSGSTERHWARAACEIFAETGPVESLKDRLEMEPGRPFLFRLVPQRRELFFSSGAVTSCGSASIKRGHPFLGWQSHRLKNQHLAHRAKAVTKRAVNRVVGEGCVAALRGCSGDNEPMGPVGGVIDPPVVRRQKSSSRSHWEEDELPQAVAEGDSGRTPIMK